VSHDFDMKGAKPVEVHRMDSQGNAAKPEDSEYSSTRDHVVYKWVVPWEKEPES